jgi:hypothetical protein
VLYFLEPALLLRFQVLELCQHFLELPLLLQQALLLFLDALDVLVLDLLF